mmetsp:Transcript_28510/g.60418  ORF Transcript_28510/g.60418 Transcript_28510/m.60418 type:complete len:308 (+) Transcript_28510:2113-3036(+)
MRSAARLKRVKVTATDVVKPMVALLTINVIILTIWTIIDPLELRTVAVAQDSFFRDVETYSICSSKNMSIFLAILCVINLGSLLFALYQAYMARKISTEFQESTYIFLAMTLILLVSFIAIPVMVVAQDNSAASYFVMASLVFVVSTSILLLIFVPKVRAVEKGNGGARNDSSSARDGIQITSSPVKQAELEREIRELKQLLSMEASRVGGQPQVSPIGLINTGSGNSSISSDSAIEAGHLPRSGHRRVQFEEDAIEIPVTANDVGSNYTSPESNYTSPESVSASVKFRLIGAGHWSSTPVISGSFG